MRGMSLKHLFGTILKVTDRDDGTVLVEGTAQAEERDSDKELIRAAGMRKALPGYMKFGNVREMHQAIAAGKAIACSVDDSGVTHLTAHVVDAGSVAKVKAGVLTGFSIGGTVLKRNDLDKSIIEELELNEISLVDRPCLPTATFQLCKIEKPAAEPVVKRRLSEELRKGLFTVGWLAEVLSTLDCLAEDSEWEALYEGDGSEIPARLKAAVAELGAILRDMAAEETAELSEGDVVVMAAKPGTLKKAEQFAALLKRFTVKPENQLEKFKNYFGDLLAKAPVAAVADEALVKRATDAEASAAATLVKLQAVQKEAADATAAMSQAGELLEKMTASHAELQVKLATKGVLQVVPVAKAADVPPVATTTETAATDPVSAVKKVHASGGTRRL